MNEQINPDALPELLRACQLVIALHETYGKSGPAGMVPGYSVKLDPQAEKQIRAAIEKALPKKLQHQPAEMNFVELMDAVRDAGIELR